MPKKKTTEQPAENKDQVVLSPEPALESSDPPAEEPSASPSPDEPVQEDVKAGEESGADIPEEPEELVNILDFENSIAPAEATEATDASGPVTAAGIEKQMGEGEDSAPGEQQETPPEDPMANPLSALNVRESSRASKVASDEDRERWAQRNERRSRQRQEVIETGTVGEDGTIIANSLQFDETQQELNSAALEKRPLLGEIVEVVADRENEERSYVKLIYGDKIIMVPFGTLAVTPDFDVRNSMRVGVDDTENIIKLRILNRMLGAKIWFIPERYNPQLSELLGVDYVGSHRAAQESRRRYFTQVQPDSTWWLYEGRKVRGRVIRIEDNNAFVDVLGYVVTVTKSNLSITFIDKMSDELHLNQECEFTILTLKRDPVTGQVVELAVTMRDDRAVVERLNRLAKSMVEGQHNVGVVHTITSNSYVFVHLHNGLRVRCFVNDFDSGVTNIRKGTRVQVRIRRIIIHDDDHNLPELRGSITRVISHAQKIGH